MLVSLRTQAEMAHTCRGTIPLATAHIEVGDTCHLVLTSGGRSYHLKATSEGECQRWVSALQQAKANATLLIHHSGENDSLHMYIFFIQCSTYSWNLIFALSKCDAYSHADICLCKELNQFLSAAGLYN